MIFIRAKYQSTFNYTKVMNLMKYDNALALRVSLETGARISDVLALREENLQGRTLRYVASKTGKPDRKVISADLAGKLRRNAANGFFFPGRYGDKPKTRQAVWRDLKRAAVIAGVSPAGLSPHFARKDYAVEVFHDKGFAAAQEALQHDRADTTMLYCFSDVLTSDTATGRGVTGQKYVFTEEELYFLAEVISNKVVDKLKKCTEIQEFI